MNGRELVNIDPISWSKIEAAGAGEIVLTSVNKEGLMNGFDNYCGEIQKNKNSSYSSRRGWQL